MEEEKEQPSSCKDISMFKALPPAFMGEKLKAEATSGNKQPKGYSLHKPQACMCDTLWSVYNRNNLLIVSFSVLGPQAVLRVCRGW